MSLSANLRAIQERLRAAAQTGGAGAGASQQEAAKKLIQAKGGKAVAGAGPKASAVQAEATGQALQQKAGQQALMGAAQASQLGQQASTQEQQFKAAQERLAAQKRMATGEMAATGAMAREQMSAGAERSRKQLSANEEMKLNQMSSSFSQRTADLASQMGIAVDDIFAGFEQSNKQLEFRKDAAELEQAAFNLDMANDTLLREYNAIWSVQNLQNDLTFQKEYAKMQMGENTKAMLDQIGWQKAADADMRTFEEEIKTMDIDEAIALADASLKDSQHSMIASGLLTSVKAYSKYSDEGEEEA